ncbi:hypothetical protein TcG_05508 [Trypanosoma cruzi]|uniref:Uncharacterized protein n=1 Tax=Trypanosoma cruzi TaxID=5693 RepID=A0A2V2VHX8_TRYCR|nr:hypothetical protein BCY84_19147 [Trypanosoma cruzi cruzi]PWU95921.1 hypothetical protein C4B63_20g323 [Trypanosoma cruzi]RNF17599.1 hypothetical protein TcG_05508 [Trypanosoma cruzi]
MQRCILARVANSLPSSLHGITSNNDSKHKVFFPLRQAVAEPSVDTNTEAYRQLAHELSLLSQEEFGRRLYRFSRTNFDPTQTTVVHALVSELISRRVQEVSIKCVREYAHLAHVAKLHKLCLDVYFARANLTTIGSVTENNDTKVGDFAVSDFVVDSAYALCSTSDLIRLASYCVKHLQQVPSLGWEVMSAFSLVRAFWRCICVASIHGRQQDAEYKQALKDASYIYDEYMELVYPDAYKELATQDAIRTVQRFVQYASSADEGEMLFFRFCLQKGFLRRPRDTTRGEGDDGFGMNAGVTVEGGKISEEQWFYASLIATCRVGNHVDSALRYFDDIGSYLGIMQVSCNDLLHSCSRKIRQDDPKRPEAAIGSRDRKSMEKVSEYLIFQLLNVLQTAKENGKIVFIARAMLRDGVQLGISVWSIVLIAAGETRAADLALAAFTQAKDALGDGSHALDRRGNEYLLQTAINALSKCQVPRFEEEYLQPCHDQQLMHCTNEFYFCALLQHAHNSMDPANGAEEVLRRMKEKGTPLTTRIISRLMKIYLRIESPKLLELYQHATQQLGTFRPSWLDELLLWADRRRYELTHGERKYILDEVQRVHGIKGMQGDLGGLRTQYALLKYDYEYSPLEVFASTSYPPETEPTILDSRVHFLLKHPHCVAHNIETWRNGCTFWINNTVGDDEKAQRFLRFSLLTNEGATTTNGEIQAEEFRLYMGRMLEALQKSNNCAV